MLKNKIITINNNAENSRIFNSLSHKLLFWALLLSFGFYSLVDAIGVFNYLPNEVTAGSESFTFVINVILYGGISLILCEILLWVYRSVLGFSLYTFIIPAQAVIDGTKWAIVVRNIVMGALNLLSVFVIVLRPLLEIIDTIVIFSVFAVFALKSQKKYVEPIVQPFVFKGLMMPIVIYTFLIAAIRVVEYFL